jgi:hypothetical protein
MGRAADMDKTSRVEKILQGEGGRLAGCRFGSDLPSQTRGVDEGLVSFAFRPRATAAASGVGVW